MGLQNGFGPHAVGPVNWVPALLYGWDPTPRLHFTMLIRVPRKRSHETKPEVVLRFSMANPGALRLPKGAIAMPG